jgi:osmotically inducible protein OsmC
LDYVTRLTGTDSRKGVTMTTTFGSAKWRGRIWDGEGAISTKSGALTDYPYGFGSRFEDKPGSNPEELIGAAHAACFTMTLSRILGEAELIVEHTETKAEVTLEKQGNGFAITSVHLTLVAKVPGADNAMFAKLAGIAKVSCPVSKLFNAKITLEATLL